MLSGVLDAIVPLALASGYLALVGGAVRLLLHRTGVRLPRGLGLTIGLGAGVGTVAVALAWKLADSAAAAVLPLAVVAFLLVVALLVPWSPFAPADGAERRRLLAGLAPHVDDVLAASAAFIAVGPILRFGLTSWTHGTNDFPSYAASVQVWLSKSAFAAQHVDQWGGSMVVRGELEKPMSTSLLLLIERITGLPTYASLTPVMLLCLGVLAATVLALVREHVPNSGLAGRLVALAPFFSIVPMSRVFDAQVGQVIATTLAAVAIAMLTRAVPPTAAGRWVHAIFAGVVTAACLGSSVTLILASGLAIVALAFWLASGPQARVRGVLTHWARAALVAVVISLPMASGYLRSLRGQTSGSDGFDIPLGSPLSLVGLQAALDDTPGGGRAAFLWIVLIVLAACGYLAYRRAHPRSHRTAWLVAITVANGAVIAVVQGADAYGTHKWMAVAMWLVAPFLLASAVVPIVGASRLWSSLLAGGLAAAAAVTCFLAARTVSYVISPDLLALAGDERLEAADTINIGLGNQYENSIAPLVIDQPTVVTDFSYAGPTPRDGDWWLVRAGAVAEEDADVVIPLNDGYSLVDIDSEIGAETVRFDATEPASRWLLSGRWYPTEETGIWSTGPVTWITFTVADELRGSDLVVTLRGARYATVEHPRTLTVEIEDGPTVSTTYRDHLVPLDTRLTVPADVVEATDGLITLALRTPDPLSPAGLGIPDNRLLGYQLMELTLAAR